MITITGTSGSTNVTGDSSVQFQWTCPAAGDYAFNTGTSGGTTNYATAIGVVDQDGDPVTFVQTTQDGGNGNGFEYGALIAFSANTGDTYTITVTTRTSPFPTPGSLALTLAWGLYTPFRLGCQSCVELNPATQCWTLAINDLSSTGTFSFGSFSIAAGVYTVVYCGGALMQFNTNVDTTPITLTDCTAGITCDPSGGYCDGVNICYDVNCLGNNATALASGCPSGGSCSFGAGPNVGFSISSGQAILTAVGYILLANILVGSTSFGLMSAGPTTSIGALELAAACQSVGPFISPGGSIEAQVYSDPTACPSDWVPAAALPYSTNPNFNGTSIPVPANDLSQSASQASGFAGNWSYACSGADASTVTSSWSWTQTKTCPGGQVITNSIGPVLTSVSAGYISEVAGLQEPMKLKLIFTPIMSALEEGALSISQTGTSLSGTFTINNASNIAWNSVTVTLLNENGVSGASSAQTVNFSASGSQNLTFTWTGGDCQPTLQITFNTVVAGTFQWNVAPILSAELLGYESVGGCGTPNAQESYGLKITNSGLLDTSNLNATITCSNPSVQVAPSTGGFGCAITPLGAPATFGSSAVCPVGTLTEGENTNIYFNSTILNGSTVVTFTVSFADDNGSYPAFTFNQTL